MQIPESYAPQDFSHIRAFVQNTPEGWQVIETCGTGHGTYPTRDGADAVARRVTTDRPFKRGARVMLVSRTRGVPNEMGTISPWITSVSGPRDEMPGWHIVKFDADGARLCIHESNMGIPA